MPSQYVPLSRQIEINCSDIGRRLLWYMYSLGTIYLVQADEHEAFEKPGAHVFWVVAGRGTL
jgi:hypothetical protein